MKHKISQSLYTYWNEIRGMRIAPRRFDIEPSRIAAILPDTFILDCSERGSAHFRLAGTRMSSLLGRDVRHGDLLDLFRAEDQPTLEHLLRTACDQAGVVVMTAAPTLPAPPSQQIEIVLLPLLHTQNTVTRLLGSACAVEPQLAARSPLHGRQCLTGHETIWPDGRPHVILQQLNRQSPFAPELRGARIVSADRRKFRVFDGGKST